MLSFFHLTYDLKQVDNQRIIRYQKIEKGQMKTSPGFQSIISKGEYNNLQ